MNEASPRTPQSTRAPEDRLDSWKEIAAYLNCDVTTVQRWEKREGMPVHRHLHDRLGSVYALRAEQDAWAAGWRLTDQIQPVLRSAAGMGDGTCRRPNLRQWETVPTMVRQLHGRGSAGALASY